MGYNVTHIAKRLVLGTMLSTLSLLAFTAQAAFPDKPVTIVVPFGVGGSSDAQARVVAQALSKKWNQPVVIDNRPGGQTVIGTSLVAKAKPDGYTILYVAFAWISNQFLIKELPYKASDLSPITTLGTYPLALLVRSDVPANTVAEYIAYAKAQNRPMNFGISTIGASMHFAALEFSNQTGVPMVFPPYKSGSIGALNDLIGKQIDGIFEGAVFKPHADGGRVKALFGDALAREGRFDLSADPAFTDAATRYGFRSGKSTHENRLETIRDVFKRHGVMIDTHTADGVKVAREHLQAGVPMIVLETALPIKFAETIVEALGQQPHRPPQFEGIEDLPKRVRVMPASTAAVQAFVAEHCVRA